MVLTWSVRWSVVVPVKRLASAKTRLRDPVGRPGRAHAELALALALDTVAAARAARPGAHGAGGHRRPPVAADAGGVGHEVADDPTPA